MSFQIDVFSIFPELITTFTNESILGRAARNELLDVRAHDLRAQTTNVHRTIDDAPFGGGAGMVMMPGPVFAAVEAVEPKRPLYYLGPAGRTFDQDLAHELAATDGFSLLCGRYEGVDERIRSELCDGEISVGDVVLAGGEAAALVVIEATARLLPGVLGNDASIDEESFANGLLEYPQYTRPAEFRGLEVPAVLRSGNHALIERWRLAQSLVRTQQQRPDLVEARGGLSEQDRAVLAEFGLLGDRGQGVTG